MIKLYNSLTRKKEEFKPLKDKEVKIYTCGPTVYNYAHLGNLRSYIFADVLRRTLELVGFKVNQIINITDVGHLTGDTDEGEDKIEKEAEREHKTPKNLADFYTKSFLSDLEKLNIERPELLPKATDHIVEMIDFIKRIEKAGFTYETDEGVYFNTVKLKNYGQLSGQKIELERKSRIGRIKGKKNPTDFALWLKITGKQKHHLMQWDSPWGKGFPGWHIECSAMSEKYLGPQFDIHTGGVDHIPIHHENEIAQSVAANAKIPAKFWLHGGFLVVGQKRMGKSEGNLLTLSELEKLGFEPKVYRFFILRNHYRSPVQFSMEKMKEAKTSLDFLCTSINRLKRPSNVKVAMETMNFSRRIQKAKKEINRAFFNDLNTPKVIDVLFELVHYLNKLKADEKIGEAEVRSALNQVYTYADSVLALNLEDLIQGQEKIPQKIIQLAEKRYEAKKQKDFSSADKLRKKIERHGYIIEDTLDKKGYRIIVKIK